MSKKCNKCGSCLLFISESDQPKYIYCDGTITIIPKKQKKTCIIL